MEAKEEHRKLEETIIVETETKFVDCEQIEAFISELVKESGERQMMSFQDLQNRLSETSKWLIEYKNRAGMLEQQKQSLLQEIYIRDNELRRMRALEEESKGYQIKNREQADEKMTLLQEEIKSVKRENTRLHSLMAEKNAAIQSIEKKLGDLRSQAEMKSENESLRKQVERLAVSESHVKTAQSEKESLQETISSQSLQIASLRRHLSAIQNQLQQAQKEKEEHANRVHEYQKYLNIERNAKLILEREVENQKSLASKHSILDVENLEIFQKSLEDLKKDKGIINERIVQLVSDLEGAKKLLEDKSSDLKEWKRKAKVEFDKARGEVLRLKEANEKLEKEASRVPEVIKEVQRREEITKELQENLKTANFAIQEKQSKLAEYEREIPQLKELMQDMEREMRYNAEVRDRFKDLAKGRAKQIKNMANELLEVEKEAREAQDMLSKQIQDIREESKATLTREIEVMTETRKRQVSFFKEQLTTIDEVIAEVSGYVHKVHSSMAFLKSGKNETITAIEERFSVLSLSPK